jgi:hypothetical protein
MKIHKIVYFVTAEQTNIAQMTPVTLKRDLSVQDVTSVLLLKLLPQ